MLPVSGAQQLKTSEAQGRRPMISASGAYSRLVSRVPGSSRAGRAETGSTAPLPFARALSWLGRPRWPDARPRNLRAARLGSAGTMRTASTNALTRRRSVSTCGVEVKSMSGYRRSFIRVAAVGQRGETLDENRRKKGRAVNPLFIDLRRRIWKAIRPGRSRRWPNRRKSPKLGPWTWSCSIASRRCVAKVGDRGGGVAHTEVGTAREVEEAGIAEERNA